MNTRSALTTLLAISVALPACGPASSSPPPTPLSASSTATPTLGSSQIMEATASPSPVGPYAYPTPNDHPQSWTDLIDQEITSTTSWQAFSAPIRGPDKTTMWNISFEYQSGWFVISADPAHFAVQNLPPTPDDHSGQRFCKFEVLWLRGSAQLESAPSPEQLHTVLVSDERVVLIDQPFGFSALLSKGNAIYVLAGYLGTMDQGHVDPCRSMLLHMLSSTVIGP